MFFWLPKIRLLPWLSSKTAVGANLLKIPCQKFGTCAYMRYLPLILYIFENQYNYGEIIFLKGVVLL